MKNEYEMPEHGAKIAYYFVIIMKNISAFHKIKHVLKVSKLGKKTNWRHSEVGPLTKLKYYEGEDDITSINNY